MITFGIHTLGCKVNFYESEWIREQLVAHGAKEIEDSSTCPEWVIINTCTVTGRADRQSRQIAYRTARQCPETRIVVTGCYANRDPEALKALPNVRHVLTNDEKFRLPGILTGAFPSPSPGWMRVTDFRGHVRAYLMVQNGCNACCAYCIIPRVRGKSRSKPVETILREIEMLEASGHAEVVLCGIHLGLYGRDLSPPQSLTTLLQAIEAHPFGGKIRISSIEPMELHEDLIQVIAGSEKVCPHLHIPLQHGDGKILKRMNRPYSPESFETLVRTIKGLIPTCTLGSDIMAGFPGETDETFESSFDFVARLPLSYLHVFPYSERPGTLSEAFSGKVSEAVKKERVARLLELARQKRREFYHSWAGKTDQVIFEQRKGDDVWTGKSLHYLPVRVKSRVPLVGQWTEAEIVSTGDNGAWGKILPTQQ